MSDRLTDADLAALRQSTIGDIQRLLAEIEALKTERNALRADLDALHLAEDQVALPRSVADARMAVIEAAVAWRAALRRLNERPANVRPFEHVEMIHELAVALNRLSAAVEALNQEDATKKGGSVGNP